MRKNKKEIESADWCLHYRRKYPEYNQERQIIRDEDRVEDQNATNPDRIPVQSVLT